MENNHPSPATNHQPRKRRFRWWHLIVIAFLLSLLIGGARVYLIVKEFLPASLFGGAPFTQTLWLEKNSFGCTRGNMVNDLLKRHLKPGMAYNDVINLLGYPDTEWRPDGCIEYRLGTCSQLTGTDTLDICFDAQYRVKSLEQTYH